ncbi:uracil permease [Hathewaya proteolytica DSM 3090]|uniref:Uracil permease n=1 Tax=Hathewaya proteolytica DSM 3090 TaxID=1121331 RepID=A0A1M6L677_9CLOT|nr:solute carrier family 23 protein [Hathewaya proteolytica]SHJ66733.1 uracil permease [Hathewaya proteolytica DSM 3090]
MKDFVDVEERLPMGKTIALSFQHLFAMIGATILVPMLTGLSPSMALFGSGVGTLLYILCTKAKLPAYVGSSFAFVVPMQIASSAYGVSGMLSGIVAAGLVYVVVAGIIKLVGIDWLNKTLSPIVVGSVIIVIGLSLANVAINWAGLNPSYLNKDNISQILVEIPRYKWLIVSLSTLGIGIIGSMFFKGFLGVIPILIAMVSGYIIALVIGAIPQEHIKEISNAPWFAMPKFTLPSLSWGAIILMLPVAFVTLAEHIGHVYVTNNIIGRDFTKEPGLHRSILGDGIATCFAGLVGAPPNTTYGENIGVMAITKIYSVWVIGGAAIIAIVLSMIGKVTAILTNIPLPVMGGVSILLFGIIASSGFRVYIENKIDFGMKRNLIIASVIIVLGVGGANISIPLPNGTSIEIAQVALATLVGIFLNLLLPEKSKSES